MEISIRSILILTNLWMRWMTKTTFLLSFNNEGVAIWGSIGTLLVRDNKLINCFNFLIHYKICLNEPFVQQSSVS